MPQSTSFILKPITSLARKDSHRSGSILSKKTLHISSSHELKQNEARQRLQTNTNALHNVLMIELTERQGHSNTKGDNVSTWLTSATLTLLWALMTCIEASYWTNSNFRLIQMTFYLWRLPGSGFLKHPNSIGMYKTKSCYVAILFQHYFKYAAA